MARPAIFSYSYADLARLSGLTKNTVHQHVTRRTFDPGSLESVVCWLARHGTLKLRQKLLLSALARTIEAPAKTQRRRR
jgi:hypothetical protein